MDYRENCSSEMFVCVFCLISVRLERTLSCRNVWCALTGYVDRNKSFEMNSVFDLLLKR